MFETTLDEFEKETKRSLSMPIAGIIIWSLIGLVSLNFGDNVSVYILVFSTGAIFPLGLLISTLRHEVLLSSKNPFAKLMGLSVLMVNLLWVIHIPLLMIAPEFVALSLGVGLGLHWVIYSWIIQHPVGLLHSIMRSVLVMLAWYLFPNNQLFAICCAIVFVYIVSISQMYNRKIMVYS